jgi:cytidyltransferase-like protein
MNRVVIYPGRFHPFHKGHAHVYKTLVKQFGEGNVYIATSDKVDPPKSPFTFEEKVKMMMHAGVPATAIVKCKQPYRPIEILDNYDSDNTVVMFAVSEKDMAEDPRFAFKPKKDGSPSYFQPAGKDMQSFEQHGYIITVPTLDFKVLGKPMRSASEFRANFANADEDTQKAMINDLYGMYDEEIYNIMSSKITESKSAKLAHILNAVQEIKHELSEEQLQEVYNKTARLMIGMQINTRKETVESLQKLDRDDVMNSEVLVPGVGVYTVQSLMQNLSRKLNDLAKEANAMTPHSYKNIKAKLDSGIVKVMLDALTTAFADLESVRRKGGSNSRVVPKDVFDDVQTKLEAKWSDERKRNIDCNNPKGFSEKAHCAGRKKTK